MYVRERERERERERKREERKKEREERDTCSVLHMNVESVQSGEAVKEQFHVLLKQKEPAIDSRSVHR